MSLLKVRYIFLALILALTFLVYSHSLKNSFTNWDDDWNLTENHLVKSLDINNIKEIFTTTLAHQVYIPLTILSYAVEYHFFGFQPLGYHLDNLLLHLTVTALIFIFAQKIGLNLLAAFLGALVFGIHPMHVESVAWITERKDVLYAFFYMLSVLSYWNYLEGKKNSYILSLVFGLLSVLSKPMALSLPLILCLCDFLKARKLDGKIILDKIPYLIYIIAIAWITYQYHMRIPLSGGLTKSFFIWTWSLMFYLQKFFWPAVLVPLYQLPQPVSIFNPDYYLSIITLIFTVLILLRYRQNRWLMFAFVWYCLSIFFLLRFDYQDKTIVADRFMYLPSVGICLLFGVVLEQMCHRWNKQKWIGYLSCFIIMASLVFKTYQQNGIWENGLTLWNYVIGSGVQDDGAYLSRGNVYNEQGQYPLAIKDYRKAVELNPNNDRALSNAGQIYLVNGKYDAAIKFFDKALAINPRSAETFLDRGTIYLYENLLSSALKDFNQALSINSNYVEAYVNRGNVYSLQGKIEPAIKDFSQAIALNPSDYLNYFSRAGAYKELEQYSSSLNDYNKLLELKKDFVEGYCERGELYLQLKRYDLAIKDFNHAFTLDPQHKDTYFYRARYFGQKGNWAQALKDLLTAQSLGYPVDPEDISWLKHKMAKSSVPLKAK